MANTESEHLHAHNRRRFFQTKTFRLLAMLFLTFLFFIVELVVGNITHSVALVADAFHMLSDVIALIIGIVSVRMVKRQTASNTYGWVRAEVVGANINTVFLLALCLTIVFDAIRRYFDPEPIVNVNLLLIVGSIGLGINIIGLFLFQGFHGHSHGGAAVTPEENNQKDEQDDSDDRFERHSTRALKEVMSDTASHLDTQHTETDHEEDDGKKGKRKKQASMNMHGVFLHVLADALGSVAVIISALIIKFVPHDQSNTRHWTVYVDPTLSIIIVIIITISTVRLFRDTTLILLQTIPKTLDIQKFKSELLKTVPEIMSIHELHIWRLTNEKIIASAHLHRQSFSNYMSVAAKVKKFFHSMGIHSVTVQYECDTEYQTPLSTSNVDDQTKLANDCLLRCDNNACDNQACCTIKSVRSDTFSHDNDDNTMQISAITQPHQYDNPLHVQIPMDESEVHEHKTF